MVNLTAHWEGLPGQSSVDWMSSCRPMHNMYAATLRCTRTLFREIMRPWEMVCIWKCFFVCLLLQYVYLGLKQCIESAAHLEDISHSQALCTFFLSHSCTRVSVCFLSLLYLHLPIIRLSEAWLVIKRFLSCAGKPNIPCFELNK